MSSPLLAELEARRARLFERLAAIGDFRRGSISENLPAVRQAELRLRAAGSSRGMVPGSCGPGRWPAAARGAGSWRPAEVEKVRGELAAYQEFAALSEQIVEVSEAICEARPVPPAAGGQAPAPEGQKKGSATALAAEAAAEVGQAGHCGGGRRWPPAAGWRRRNWPSVPALTQLAVACWSRCWPLIGGSGGPRGCLPAGHQAEFASYRDKTIGTVLGPVTLRRAWYRCPGCGHGLAPRDGELGMGRPGDVAGAAQDGRPRRRGGAVRRCGQADR